MSMQITKMPILRYNPVNSAVLNHGEEIPVILIKDGYAIVEYNNGYMLVNIKESKTAGVTLPNYLVKNTEGLGVVVHPTYVVFYYKDDPSSSDYTYWAEIGKDTMLVYKIEPNDNNYNVTETQYFLDLYGTKLMYTLSEPKISNNIIDNILDNAAKTEFRSGVLIDLSLINQRVVDEYDDFDDIADEDDLDTEPQNDIPDEQEDDEDTDFDDDEIEEEDFDDETEEDDFFDDEIDEEDESPEDRLASGEIDLATYGELKFDEYVASLGMIESNKLIDKNFWALFARVTQLMPSLRSLYVDIWNIVVISGDQFKNAKGYVEYSDVTKLAVLNYGFCIAANISGAYVFDSDEEFLNSYKRDITKYFKNSLCSSERYSQKLKDCLKEDFNFIAAIPQFLQHDINIPYFYGNNYGSNKDIIGYERYRNYWNCKYSFMDVDGWLSADHLIQRVKNPKFKYPFAYCNGSESLFRVPLLLNAMLQTHTKNTSEHTFMSDVYNVVAAPNICKVPTMSDGTPVYESAHDAAKSDSLTWGSSWSSRVPYNMARRYVILKYNVRSVENDRRVYGLWDDLESVVSLPVSLAKHKGYNYNVSKMAKSYYAERWSAMCPEYDLYLRHNFNHHAFREVAFTCFIGGCLFLLDIIPHDDNYIGVSDEEAVKLRRIMLPVVQTTVKYLVNACGDSFKGCNSELKILSVLGKADNRTLYQFGHTVSLLIDLLYALKEKCADYIETYTVFEQIVLGLNTLSVARNNIAANDLYELEEVIDVIKSCPDRSKLEETLYDFFCLANTRVRLLAQKVGLTEDYSYDYNIVDSVASKLKTVFIQHYGYVDETNNCNAWFVNAPISKKTDMASMELAARLSYHIHVNPDGYLAAFYMCFGKANDPKVSRMRNTNTYTYTPGFDETNTSYIESWYDIYTSDVLTVCQCGICASRNLTLDGVLFDCLLPKWLKILEAQDGNWNDVVKFTELYSGVSSLVLSLDDMKLMDKDMYYMFHVHFTWFREILTRLNLFAISTLPEDLFEDVVNTCKAFVTRLDVIKTDAGVFNIYYNEDDITHSGIKYSILDFAIPLKKINQYSSDSYKKSLRKNGFRLFDRKTLSLMLEGYDQTNQAHLKAENNTDETMYMMLSDALMLVRNYIASAIDDFKQHIDLDELKKCKTIEDTMNIANYADEVYSLAVLLNFFKHCLDEYVTGTPAYNELLLNTKKIVRYK